jgi:hypothetical protein
MSKSIPQHLIPGLGQNLPLQQATSEVCYSITDYFSEILPSHSDAGSIKQVSSSPAMRYFGGAENGQRRNRNLVDNRPSLDLGDNG